MKTIPVSLIIPIRHIKENSYEIWMQLRSENGPLNGFLEFPGGKISSGESPREAAKREFEEETGVKLGDLPFFPFKNYYHEYLERRVSLFTHVALVEEEGLGALPELSSDTRLLGGQWRDVLFENPLKSFESQTGEGKLLEANRVILHDLSSFLKEKREEKNNWSHL